MNTITRLIKSKIFLALVGVVVVISIGSIYLASRYRGTTPTVAVRRGSISAMVIVTGKTKPAESVDLAFERSGRVTNAPVDVGAHVTAGQALVILDSSEISTQLLQDQANVEAQQAKLDELKRGTRPEEINIEEAKVENAKASVVDAKQSLMNAIQDAYTKSDDAIRNKMDQFLSNPRSANPQINFLVSDPTVELAIKQGRVNAEAMLNAWQSSLATFSVINVEAYEPIANANLAAVKTLLENAALALNNLSAGGAVSSATVSGWKTDISTARTNINTARTNLLAAGEKRRSAEADLTIEENQLALEQAGSTPDAIAAQEALLRQADAKAATTRAQLAKTIVRSPINGIVTKQNAKTGEIIAANSTVASVISESNLEIEANVPEVDIGKIKIDNPVSITLDAFPGETFKGSVVKIDPAETVVDGVVNYKITIVFDSRDERLKSGLTSNLSIETVKKSDTLILPQFAIIERDNGTFVQKLVLGKTVEMRVTIGIRGQNGNVEILSGLSEGEAVLNIGIKHK